jgi:hypothetical protein
MHVNSLESVFRPIPRKVARIADVIGEIIGFPPMRKFGSRILAVERWVATAYVAVAAILEDVLYLDREDPNKQCVVTLFEQS